MESKLKASSIIGGGDQKNRVINDVYPTPIECTIALMLFLEGQLPTDIKLEIWEPACDVGSMSKIMTERGHKVYSSDLRQTEFADDQYDFLSQTLSYKPDAIITNPPFNLSHKFIEISLVTADIVCMLLKSQYWHAKKRTELFRNNMPAFICPLTWRPDFDGRGAPTMDLLWTIWIKGQHDSKYRPLDKPIIETKGYPTLFDSELK